MRLAVVLSLLLAPAYASGAPSAAPAGGSDTPPACPPHTRRVHQGRWSGCLRSTPDGPVREGTWVRKRADEVLLVDYRDGRRHGRYIRTTSGEIEVAGRYEEGRRHGLWRWPSRCEPSEGRFEHGRRVGPWRLHTSCGAVSRLPRPTLAADVTDVLARFVTEVGGRCEVAVAEAALLGEAAADGLLQIAADPAQDPVVRAEAAYAARHDPRARKVALALLDHPHGSARYLALGILREVGRPEDALHLVRSAQENESIVADVVARIGDASSLAALRQRLRSEQRPRQRRAWTRALAEILVATARNPVRALMAERLDPPAFQALRHLPTRTDRRTLRALSRRPGVDERLLLRLRSQHWPLARRLQETHVRRLATYAIDDQRPREAHAFPFRELLALGPGATPVLSRLLLDGIDLSVEEARRATGARHTEPSELTARGLEARIRVNLVWVLGEIGDARAVPGLRTLLQSSRGVRTHGMTCRNGEVLFCDGLEELGSAAREAIDRIEARARWGRRPATLRVRVEGLPAGASPLGVDLFDETGRVQREAVVSSGRALFRDLPPGAYTAVIRDARFAVVKTRVAAPGVGVRLRPATVRGRIRSAAGAPVSGVELTLVWSSAREPLVQAQARSGPDGRFVLPFHEPDPWLLTVTSPRHRMPDRTKHVRAGDVGVSLTVESALVVRGVVRTVGGAPVRTDVLCGDRRAETDAEGRFRIESAPVGCAVRVHWAEVDGEGYPVELPPVPAGVGPVELVVPDPP